MLLCASFAGRCSREAPIADAASPGAQPVAAADTGAPSAPDAQEAPDAQGGGAGSIAPQGIYPSREAIAAITDRPAMIVVQRARASSFERLESIRCTSDPASRGRGEFVTQCEWRSARCEGRLRVATLNVIGGGGSNLDVQATPRTPADATACATIAGVFNGQRGGPVPFPMPNVPNKRCFEADWTWSADRAACVAADGEQASRSYLGVCCVGPEAARFAIDADRRSRWLSNDGAALVVAPTGATVSREAAQSNAVFLRIARGARMRDLRVRDVFDGDPVLAAGTSFSFNVSIDGASLRVGSIGGAEHALPLDR